MAGIYRRVLRLFFCLLASVQPVAAAGFSQVESAAQAAFNNESISGMSLAIYSARGRQVFLKNIDCRWPANVDERLRQNIFPLGRPGAWLLRHIGNAV